MRGGTGLAALLLLVGVLIPAGVSAGPASAKLVARATATPAASITAEERNVLTAADYLRLAKNSKALGQLDQARDYLQKIIALPFPADKEGQHLLAGAYLLLAEIQLSQRRSKDAEHSAQEALCRCVSSPCPIVVKTYRLLAQIADAAGQSEKALDLNRKAEDVEAKIANRGHAGGR